MLACLVGAVGFEPTTFRPPAGCATRLRHAPWRPILGQATRGQGIRAGSVVPGTGGLQARALPRNRRLYIQAAQRRKRMVAQERALVLVAKGLRDRNWETV